VSQTLRDLGLLVQKMLWCEDCDMRWVQLMVLESKCPGCGPNWLHSRQKIHMTKKIIPAETIVVWDEEEL